MPGGWGRKAAGRLGVDNKRALEDDQLLKELNTQLNFTVDYDQWKRDTELKAKQASTKNTRPPRRVLPKFERAPSVKTFFTASSAPSFLKVKLDSAASFECHHSHGRAESPEIDVEQKNIDDRIKILRLKIHARKYTIDEYKQRYDRLLATSMELQNLMEKHEAKINSEAKALLRKYEKFRGGISTLNSKLESEVGGATAQLEYTKLKVHKDLLVLETKVKEVDNKLQEVQQELNILQNYKDKEYPVKALMIAELQKEIEMTKISNQDDTEELEYIVGTEIGKYKKQQDGTASNLTKTVTEEALKQMHPTLKDMALQNMVMKKEMEFHLKEVAELEELNAELEDEVKSLLKDPKTNAKFQLFPEFFPRQEKCTPDMDVILDIPTQEWLPI